MFDEESGKSSGTTTISAKVQREEFSKFKNVCDHNDENINSALRRLILSEIAIPKPARVAGKSIFEYNRSKENFTWKIVLDDGQKFAIDNNLPASSIEQLYESLTKAIEERNVFIKKNKRGSISLPTKLLRKRK